MVNRDQNIQFDWPVSIRIPRVVSQYQNPRMVSQDQNIQSLNGQLVLEFPE